MSGVLVLRTRVMGFSLLVAAFLCSPALLAGCAGLPRDQHGMTERIRQKGVLIVGVSREKSDSDLSRREKQLVEKIARRLGARVQWRPGNAHELLEELEQLKLPLVAATVPSDSPFAESVGLSQPYLKDGPRHKDYCLAVAPGENRLLLIVDQIIAEEQSEGGGNG